VRQLINHLINDKRVAGTMKQQIISFIHSFVLMPETQRARRLISQHCEMTIPEQFNAPHMTFDEDFGLNRIGLIATKYGIIERRKNSKELVW